jgi:hypothetical protein
MCLINSALVGKRTLKRDVCFGLLWRLALMHIHGRNGSL